MGKASRRKSRVSKEKTIESVARSIAKSIADIERLTSKVNNRLCFKRLGAQIQRFLCVDHCRSVQQTRDGRERRALADVIPRAAYRSGDSTTQQFNCNYSSSDNGQTTWEYELPSNITVTIGQSYAPSYLGDCCVNPRCRYIKNGVKGCCVHDVLPHDAMPYGKTPLATVVGDCDCEPTEVWDPELDDESSAAAADDDDEEEERPLRCVEFKARGGVLPLNQLVLTDKKKKK